MPAKIQTRTRVRIRAYDIIARAVEEGVQYGYNRAHKHVSNPPEATMIGEIEQAVLNSLCEVLNFDEEEEG